MPQARNCSTTSALCFCAKKVWMLAATTGPTSGTSSSCSTLAARMRTSDPKCLARSRPSDRRCGRIPARTEALQGVVFLLFSSPIDQVLRALIGHALTSAADLATPSL
jgi:hypothetical protein